MPQVFDSAYINAKFASQNPELIIAESTKRLLFTHAGTSQQDTNSGGKTSTGSNAKTFTWDLSALSFTTLKIYGIGGGGGGDIGPCTNNGGGGAGAFYTSIARSSLPGLSLTIIVGAGGKPAQQSNARSGLNPPYGVTDTSYNGGASSVSANGTILAIAYGGGSGTPDNCSGLTAKGAGNGTGSGASITYGSGTTYTGGTSVTNGGHTGVGGGGAASPTGGNGGNGSYLGGDGSSGYGGTGATLSSAGSGGTGAASATLSQANRDGKSYGGGGGNMETDGVNSTYTGPSGRGAPGAIWIEIVN